MTPVDPAPAPAPAVTKRGALPTAKLISAAGTMIVLYALRQFVNVDQDLEQIVNLVVPLIVAYVVPNSDTPGGVPDARPELRDQAGYGLVELVVAVLLVLILLVVLMRLL